MLFGKMKKKLADHLVKQMEEYEYFLKYENNCKHCVHYNLIVDTGDVVVDECLNDMGIPNYNDYVPCKYFKLKKEEKRKTNLFGIEMEE